MSSDPKPLNVLVVDDSAYNRRVISDLLSGLPSVNVVGKASDGDEAFQLVQTLKPDLLTLDLEMPKMDGFAFLRILMAKFPTPVIVVSGNSTKENVFRALELGALDFVSKPSRTISSELATIRDELAAKVAIVRQLSPAVLMHGAQRRRRATSKPVTQMPQTSSRPEIILALGASTGGPSALIEFFRGLPVREHMSIVVAQHMPERFTRTFAARLNRISSWSVKEVAGTMPLIGGHAYVCPGGRCMTVSSDNVMEVKPSPADRFVPSVDRLFESAAMHHMDKLFACVLTGMGDDGAEGAKFVKKYGGEVFAESEETAVISGMPNAAVRTGSVTATLALPALIARINTLTRNR